MKILGSRFLFTLCLSMALCVVGNIITSHNHLLRAMQPMQDLEEHEASEIELSISKNIVLQKYWPIHRHFIKSLLPEIWVQIIAYLTRFEELSDLCICTDFAESIWHSIIKLQRFCDQTIILVLLKTRLSEEKKSLCDVKMNGLRNRTILHFASFRKNYPSTMIIDIIIAVAEDTLWELLSASDTFGGSPLCFAVVHNDINLTTKFIEAADLCDKTPELIMMRGERGATVLHLAAQVGYLDIVKLLIHAATRCGILGNFLVMQLPDKRTALHCAAEANRAKIVNELLQAAVPCQIMPNFLFMQSEQHKTALHCAVASDENIDAIKVLINVSEVFDCSGFFLDIQDERGQRALDIAEEMGHAEIVKELKSAAKRHKTNSLQRCYIL